jgi:alkyldihydroxyacetonephosphate synthase
MTRWSQQLGTTPAQQRATLRLMVQKRDELRWNGWGFRRQSFGLSEVRTRALVANLAQRLNVHFVPQPRAVPLERVELPPARLPSKALRALEKLLTPARVHTSAEERARHAAGKSLPDILRTRTGKLDRAPDIVVYPTSDAEVAAILAWAEAHRLSVVPFGGGTSVVGGVDPLHTTDKAGVLTLDTTLLDKLVSLDRTSLTATFEAGIDGPSLEQALSARGFTLGHFPQSFEHSTLGGWIAARSSGQQSDGYGGIDAMLVSVKLVTPRGELVTLAVPRRATGPDLNAVVLGSEGTLGVIVQATLRIRRKPALQDIRGMLFRDLGSGTRAIRGWLAAGLPMTMMRLSDARETELSLLLRHDPARRFDVTTTLLSATRALGYREQRALMLFGLEGDDRAQLAAQMLRAHAIGVSHGGLPLGKGPGETWKRDRFRNPYLRDLLLDHGVAIDTMETAFAWSRLQTGHRQVVKALEDATTEHAGGGFAMAHVSHSYADGACVYFLVIYPVAADDPLRQWQQIKRAATEAIVEAGGTLSHHHGVGTDHAPWLEREHGALGMAALKALKTAFDPQGVMNPGKLAL